MTKTIPLTRDLVALVDDEDYDRLVSVGGWYAMPNGAGNNYAGRTVRREGKRTTERMHRFLTGWPLVDHVNGNGLDNRRSNLREATSHQNAQNRPKPKANTSGYKGVYMNDRGTWSGQIYANGKRVRLGRFADPADAARAYDDAARRMHGEFATLNFPEASERVA